MKNTNKNGGCYSSNYIWTSQEVPGNISNDMNTKNHNLEDDHDATISVADNGFVVKIGEKLFIFSDLEALDNWVFENFKTPKAARDFVDSSNGINTKQREAIARFNFPSEEFRIPYIRPIVQPYKPTTPEYTTTVGDPIPDDNTTTGSTSNVYTTDTTISDNTNDSFYRSFINKLGIGRGRRKKHG